MDEMIANAKTWFRIRAHALLVLLAVTFYDVTLHRHRNR